ncbi:MAG: STAS domain-containing protein [Lachnospiraceae bacterium]|mgnify:FL=1|jgi:anti-anti-sigma factor|nr:STAS domain-containing protein [Lachnospiraceae bacterium]
MDIKLINRGATGELIFVGRLDANSAPEAEEIVKQMIERFDTIVLNMEQLDYISSAGLRVIKIIHMGMKKKNGELILTKVQKMVMEVFEMVGFAGLLKFE